MKRTIIFIFLICSSFLCFSQKSDSLFFANMQVKYIHIREGQQKKDVLPFASVHILDARDDTAIIGFERNFTHERKICFEKNVSTELTNYISTNYFLQNPSDTSWNLFIVLKKLWLTRSVDSVNLNYGEPQFASQVIFKADLFSEKNGAYHALYKVDSFIITSNFMRKYDSSYIKDAINGILAKALNKPFSALRKGKKEFSFVDINSYEKANRNANILNTIEYKKGVYKTFEEFKNNAPSIDKYEIRTGRKTIYMVIKDDEGQESLLRDYWGYCDGKSLFIKSSDKLFQLYKSGYTFNIHGFKSLTKINTSSFEGVIISGLITNSGGNKPSRAIVDVGIKVPLQLDMEIGELF